MIRALDEGFTIDVDQADPRTWCDDMTMFRDANVYQLNEYSSSWPCSNDVSRFVLRDRAGTVAMAEVRLRLVPILRCGVAYVFRGPLTMRVAKREIDSFRQTLRALRNEYVCRRRLVLRIHSNLVEEFDGDALGCFAAEGYQPVQYLGPRQSLMVDLGGDIEIIRSNLDKKWRNCLRKAEKSGLEIVSGTGLAHFDAFIQLYAKMLQRKQFSPTADILRHRQLQQDLPDAYKMTVVLALSAGRPCAGAIYSGLGETAIYLFGATDDEGLHNCASYLAQWHIVTQLQCRGVKYYDLNGVNPTLNPGTFHFKRGLAGKTGIHVTRAKQFQASASALTSVAIGFVERRVRRNRGW